MIASLVASLLAGAAHGEPPASAVASNDDRIAAIARIARSGDLTVAGTTEEGRTPRAVLDVDAAGCSVAFKTATSSTGFRAQIADFRRDLMIVMASGNEVQVIDKGDRSKGLILRAKRNGTILRDGLLDLKEAYHTSEILL
jgi:hypothetical protein